MFGKKNPVLTATMCTALEQIRLAIEVMTGKRTSFVQIDFNTRKGKVRVGDEILELVRFERYRYGDDTILMDFGDGPIVALFYNHTVRVMSENNPRKVQTEAGECTLRWIGNAFSDRREEPLLLETWRRCAEARGTTIEQLLANA